MFLAKANANTVEVKDILQNIEQILIDLGTAKLNFSYHTFVHYFNSSDFVEQFNNAYIYYTNVLEILIRIVLVVKTASLEKFNL